MGKGLSLICTCAFLLFLGLELESHAQIVEFAPIHQVKIPKNTAERQQLRIQDTQPIPFWDDFSQGLDTMVWEVNGASYTETIGIDAPSVGQVLFNGVDANGKPYSLSQRDIGITDMLTSKVFDLSGQNSNSLYLSYFWQAGGKAEYPDSNDQFFLQFLNESGNWITVWNQFGGIEENQTMFSQEIIQVGPEYQHEAFQFRFVADGRQVGPFDSWILDYVYFNYGRSTTDLNYKDRSLTQVNQVQLGDYAAYPFPLIEGNQEGFWSRIENQFYNLENRFRAMEYTIQLRDTLTNSIVAINQNTPFDPVPNSKERRSFTSNEFDEAPISSGASALEFKTSLTTGDDLYFEVDGNDTTFFQTLDYRVNDTVKSYFPVQDYFSYDRGTADYAAGINQKSGMLAVKYDTPEEVFLKGISINFTNPNQANQAIDILVWKDLDQGPIYRREDLIPVKEAGEEFLYYSLDTNIQVSGEFYIGYAQFTNDFIHVGLDKSNDQGDKLYYNVLGAWEENTEVQGAMMIRPHVSVDAPFEESSVPEARLIKVFPNPVETILNLEGSYSDLRIFDSFGREIFLQRERSQEGEIINFTGQHPGIYVINVVSEDGSQSIRILVK
ncbi:T9SS type A sorting domain-containing protein [Algoriphagus halophilus]|uniref:Por secretion system C-terminal sorting domain-containing protein n=1 Tax=Algoriphagus halophilus TaxID=226505 RepID=A0A1N6DI32_9BACT|nr:T9SS type A sorting domain-containing protein [Algoriphagus halophilus]SIN70386.1 Por secretion system C-terminal sorting domain-containing protein [Algoriphagus halophilus]